MTMIIKNILEETKQLFDSLSEGFLTIGKNLYEIFTKEIWKGEYDSYEEYLDYVGLSMANASKIRQVYEHYVLKLGYTDTEKLAKIPYTSLYSSIAIATSKSWVNEKVELAEKKLLRGKDLEDEKRVALKGECERHSWQKYRKCEKCGIWEKDYD